MIDIDLFNWGNIKKPPELVVAIGYYIQPHRISIDGVKKKLNPNKIVDITLGNIENIQREMGDDTVFLLFNDASPVSIPKGAILNAAPKNPVLVARPNENQGVGGKENFMQSMSNYLGAKYMFTVAADVKLTSNIFPLFDAFSAFPSTFITVVNAGFIGNLFERTKSGERFIETVQIGNALCYRVELFEEVGYVDPKMRYFEDLDLIYRAQQYGYTSYMDMSVTGKTTSSGAGGTSTFDLKLEWAKYLSEVSPYLSYSIDKRNRIIIRKNTKNKGLMRGKPRWVGQSALSQYAIEQIKNRI